MVRIIFCVPPSHKKYVRTQSITFISIIYFSSSIKDLVRSGIPHHFRGMAWQLLCGAHDSEDKLKYSEYMKSQSACEKVIRRDIARTYPEHDFFKKKDGIGQEALFNVMKAYSIHDREVGYCQGTAFIVGLLLMQVYTILIILQIIPYF